MLGCHRDGVGGHVDRIGGYSNMLGNNMYGMGGHSNMLGAIGMWFEVIVTVWDAYELGWRP